MHAYIPRPTRHVLIGAPGDGSCGGETTSQGRAVKHARALGCALATHDHGQSSGSGGRLGASSANVLPQRRPWMRPREGRQQERARLAAVAQCPCEKLRSGALPRGELQLGFLSFLVKAALERLAREVASL
eukprot:365085-Chlamydomonas_euryale.AAC.9